ncbi:hypothetical protein M3194_21270 [Paenibacillus glycanilyticus]|uniref:hypothetical protein n=1 Tax=Paenibacillus glycanilyticus TaxID=126569 RepID=UPI00203DB667|nr:hypothetical protein [Paenibacillus glycanilyticus]MCM3629867.1 hypothetical protein [Paenibacillus glycanilyticus]
MDWYVILFLAIVLLIVHMKEIGEHRHVSHYFLPHRELRLSHGIFLLLIHFVSGLPLFIPIAVTYRYHYAGGAVLALAGVVVMAAVVNRLEMRRNEIASSDNVTEYLRRLFRGKSHIPMLIVLLAAVSEGLVLNTWFAGYLLNSMFGIPPLLTIALLLAFTLVYAGLGGINGFHRVGLWLFVFFFAALTFIPVSVYLLKGIDPTWLQLQELHLLQADPKYLLAGTLAYAGLFAGRLMLQMLVYPEYSLIKKERSRMTFRLATACWCALPLAGSIILLYLLSLSQPSGASPIPLPDMLAVIPSELALPVLYLLLLLLLSSFAIGAGVSLLGMLHALHGSCGFLSSTRRIYAMGVFLCAIPLAAVPFMEEVVPAGVVFYAHLFLSAAYPLYKLRNRSGLNGYALSGAILLATCVGCAVTWSLQWVWGSAACVMISYIYVRVYVRNIKKI